MFELAPHTADVRMLVSAGNLEELFRDAARGLASLSEVESEMVATRTRSLTIDSADLPSLLVDFLNELLVVLHVHHLVFIGFEAVSIGEHRLEGIAEFSSAHTWSRDVKAVTYHDTGLRFDGETWSTVVVMDI